MKKEGESWVDEAVTALRVLNAWHVRPDPRKLRKAIGDCYNGRLTIAEMMAVYAYRQGCHLRQRDREQWAKKKAKKGKPALRVVGGTAHG